MRGTARLFGFELLWLICGCAVGALLWFIVASSYNEASDAFWTANSEPPPIGMYDSPTHLRFVFLFVPYAVSVGFRLLLSAAKRPSVSGPVSN